MGPEERRVYVAMDDDEEEERGGGGGGEEEKKKESKVDFAQTCHLQFPLLRRRRNFSRRN